MSYLASSEYDTVEIPCTCEDSHGTHFAYVRKEIGGRAAMEVINVGQSEGEIAGVYHAIFRSLVDWDIPGPDGDKLPITPQTVDELRIEVVSVLRGPAIEAVRRGSEPLPNASGGRSRGTSPATRSQRRSAKTA